VKRCHGLTLTALAPAPGGVLNVEPLRRALAASTDNDPAVVTRSVEGHVCWMVDTP
jgi:hypothetical protein